MFFTLHSVEVLARAFDEVDFILFFFVRIDVRFESKLEDSSDVDEEIDSSRYLILTERHLRNGSANVSNVCRSPEQTNNELSSNDE